MPLVRIKTLTKSHEKIHTCLPLQKGKVVPVFN